MKLESQVVSLELAKKLKELGVKQDSLFCWIKNLRYEKIAPYLVMSNNTGIPDKTKHTYEINSAFTSSELGEMLPKVIQLSCDDCYFVQSYTNTNGHWCIAYESYIANQFTGKISQEKESDARAKMLIYLIENKLIKI